MTRSRTLLFLVALTTAGITGVPALAQPGTVQTQLTSSFLDFIAPTGAEVTSFNVRMHSHPGVEFEQLHANGILPSLTRDIEPYPLLPFEELAVAVNLHGWSNDGEAEVETAVVLILDFSSSMLPLLDLVREAVDSLLATLRPPVDNVSIVVFGQEGVVLSPLTSDLQLIQTALRSRQPGGPSNIASALEQAASVIAESDAPVRYAVLFTDGAATPDPTDQSRRINEFLNSFSTLDIPIFTVGLGEIDYILMDAVARRTGASFVQIATPQELAKTLVDVRRTALRRVPLTSVRINDVFNPLLAILPGSFAARTPAFDPVDTDLLRAIAASFEQTNALSLPTIAILPEPEILTYSFAATATPPGDGQCIFPNPITAPRASLPSEVTLRAEDASIDASAGPATLRLDQREVNILPCDVYTASTWSEATRRLDISVWNALDHPVWNFEIYMNLARGFAFAADGSEHQRAPQLAGLASGEHFSVGYQVFVIPGELGPRQTGANIGSHGDDIVGFDYPTLLFRIDPTEAAYDGLIRSITSLDRMEMKRNFEALLGYDLSGIFGLDVVAETNPLLLDADFTYRVTAKELPGAFDRRLYDYKVFLDQLLGVEPVDSTGNLLVRIVDEMLEIYVERRAYMIVPPLYTSDTFQP